MAKTDTKQTRTQDVSYEDVRDAAEAMIREQSEQLDSVPTSLSTAVTNAIYNARESISDRQKEAAATDAQSLSFEHVDELQQQLDGDVEINPDMIVSVADDLEGFVNDYLRDQTEHSAVTSDEANLTSDERGEILKEAVDGGRSIDDLHQELVEDGEWTDEEFEVGLHQSSVFEHNEDLIDAMGLDRDEPHQSLSDDFGFSDAFENGLEAGYEPEEILEVLREEKIGTEEARENALDAAQKRLQDSDDQALQEEIENMSGGLTAGDLDDLKQKAKHLDTDDAEAFEEAVDSVMKDEQQQDEQSWWDAATGFAKGITTGLSGIPLTGLNTAEDAVEEATQKERAAKLQEQLDETDFDLSTMAEHAKMELDEDEDALKDMTEEALVKEFVQNEEAFGEYLRNETDMDDEKIEALLRYMNENEDERHEVVEGALKTAGFLGGGFVGGALASAAVPGAIEKFKEGYEDYRNDPDAELMEADEDAHDGLWDRMKGAASETLAWGAGASNVVSGFGDWLKDTASQTKKTARSLVDDEESFKKNVKKLLGKEDLSREKLQEYWNSFKDAPIKKQAAAASQLAGVGAVFALTGYAAVDIGDELAEILDVDAEKAQPNVAGATETDADVDKTVDSSTDAKPQEADIDNSSNDGQSGSSSEKQGGDSKQDSTGSSSKSDEASSGETGVDNQAGELDPETRQDLMDTFAGREDQSIRATADALRDHDPETVKAFLQSEGVSDEITDGSIEFGEEFNEADREIQGVITEQDLFALNEIEGSDTNVAALKPIAVEGEFDSLQEAYQTGAVEGRQLEHTLNIMSMQADTPSTLDPSDVELQYVDGQPYLYATEASEATEGDVETMETENGTVREVQTEQSPEYNDQAQSEQPESETKSGDETSTKDTGEGVAQDETAGDQATDDTTASSASDAPPPDVQSDIADSIVEAESKAAGVRDAIDEHGQEAVRETLATQMPPEQVDAYLEQVETPNANVREALAQAQQNTQSTEAAIGRALQEHSNEDVVDALANNTGLSPDEAAAQVEQAQNVTQQAKMAGVSVDAYQDIQDQVDGDVVAAESGELTADDLSDLRQKAGDPSLSPEDFQTVETEHGRYTVATS